MLSCVAPGLGVVGNFEKYVDHLAVPRVLPATFDRRSHRIWRGRLSIIENVGEQPIVEDAKAAANHRLAIAQQLFPEIRNVGEAEARAEVLLVPLLLDNAVEATQVVVVDRRVLELVGRASVVLITEAEVQAQVRAGLPGVLEEVVLRGQTGVNNRAAECLAHRGGPAGIIIQIVAQSLIAAAWRVTDGTVKVIRDGIPCPNVGEIDANLDEVFALGPAHCVLNLIGVVEAALRNLLTRTPPLNAGNGDRRHAVGSNVVRPWQKGKAHASVRDTDFVEQRRTEDVGVGDAGVLPHSILVRIEAGKVVRKVEEIVRRAEAGANVAQIQRVVAGDDVIALGIKLRESDPWDARTVEQADLDRPRSIPVYRVHPQWNRSRSTRTRRDRLAESHTPSAWRRCGGWRRIAEAWYSRPPWEGPTPSVRRGAVVVPLVGGVEKQLVLLHRTAEREAEDVLAVLALGESGDHVGEVVCVE